MWPEVNPQHRKIVSYRKAEPSDPTFDLAEGHGTAVAGCIAGDAQPAAADDDNVEQVLLWSVGAKLLPPVATPSHRKYNMARSESMMFSRRRAEYSTMVRGMAAGAPRFTSMHR